MEIGPSAASVAWSTFSGKFQGSPESLKVTMELIVYRFVFVLEHNTNGKKFGSQQQLIERLLGCSLGIKLTQSFREDSSPLSGPQMGQHVCSWTIRAFSFTLTECTLQASNVQPFFKTAASELACLHGAWHCFSRSLKSKGAGLFHCCQKFFIKHGEGWVRWEIQAVKTRVSSATEAANRDENALSERRPSCVCVCVRACAHTCLSYAECLMANLHTCLGGSEIILISKEK